MADKLDLKIYLQPEITNIDKIKKQLEDVAKDSGNPAVEKKMKDAALKSGTLDNLTKGNIDASNIKEIRNLMLDIYKSFYDISKLLGAADSPVSKTIVKINADLEKLNKQLLASEERLEKISKQGKIDKNTSEVSLFKKTADEMVRQKNIYRDSGSGYRGQITSYDTLIKQDFKEGSKEDIQRKQLVEEIAAYQKQLNVELQKELKIRESINAKIDVKQAELQTAMITPNGFSTSGEGQVNNPDNISIKDAEIDSQQITIDEIAKASLAGTVATKTATAKGLAANAENLREISGNNADEILNTGEARAVPIQEKEVGTIGKAIRNMTMYTLVLGNVKKAARSAATTIKTLDKALTEQAMVSQTSREATYALLSSYQEIAKTAGATTKEVATVATAYFRQGKSAEDALKLTEAAVKAAKVASISTSDSVDYLTTAINGFKLKAEDAMEVSDRFAALAASSATSYDELATALSKVASQANLAGMSMDYTLGLLAKGIETTREAPETIGTALKTVIARMREVGDYGETLEGDTNINNVEQQLSYVGIALRNNNGELRSTEDVLDEVGKKWDKMNNNQQAAIAKALAGTRQQSRLISMMNDYERTLELVEISERSNGATAAQAATYMEGLAAATNKVSVAWEKVVTTFINSEIIINIINSLAQGLDNLAEITGTLGGQVLIYGSLLAITLQFIAAKAQEKIINNYNLKQQAELNAAKAKEIQTSALARLNLAQENATKAKQMEVTDDLTTQLLQEGLARAQLKGDIAAEAKFRNALAKEAEDDVKIKAAQIEATQQLADAEKNYNIATLNANSAIAENAIAQSKSLSVLSSFVPVLGIIITLTNTYKMAKAKSAAASTASAVASSADTVAKTAETGAVLGLAGAFKKLYAAMGPIGWAILAISAAATVLVLLFRDTREEVEKVNENLEDLNNKIYKLNTNSANIETLTTKFDKLNDSIFKTKEDLTEMNQLLKDAEQYLTEEQLKVYQTKGDAGKIAYLKSIIEANEALADTARQMQFAQIAAMGFNDQVTLLAEGTAGAAAVIDALTNSLNKYINTLEEAGMITENESDSFKNLAKKYIDSQDAQTLYNKYLNTASFTDETGVNWSNKRAAKDAFSSAGVEWDSKLWKDALKKGKFEVSKLQSLGPDNLNKLFGNVTEAVNKAAISDLVSVFQQAESIQIGTELISSAVVIDNAEDYSLTEVIKAYREVEKINSDIAKDIAGNEIYTIVSNLGNNNAALQWISDMRIGTTELKDYETALKSFGVSENDVGEKISETLSFLSSEDLSQEALKDFAKNLGIADDNIELFLNSVSDLYNQPILQTGQDLKAFKSSIQEIYEAQQKWNEMDIQEQTSFFSKHEAFAKDPELMHLLKTGGDLQAYFQSDYFQKKLEQMKNELIAARDAAIAIGNEAMIIYYQQELAALESNELYLANLEFRLEREEKALEQYKNLLQTENDATIEALEKRKKAYEKYFNDINEAYEDSNYAEEVELLIENIGKMASSTDATSLKKIADLEATLKDKQDERVEELRQRAQEAIIENIENEISAIEENTEKLLENSRLLLAQLSSFDTGAMSTYMGKSVLDMISNGSTALQLEDSIASWLSTTGYLLSAKQYDVLDDVSITDEENNTQTIVFNIEGNEQTLTGVTADNFMELFMKLCSDLGIV